MATTPNSTPFDPAIPVRGLPGIERLVAHVVGTDAHGETEWLEWKSTLDLGAAVGRFTVAKAVLGFSNRDPERAAKWVGGCAYVVLGATPAGVVGQTSIDPAEVGSALRPYLG